MMSTFHQATFEFPEVSIIVASCSTVFHDLTFVVFVRVVLVKSRTYFGNELLRTVMQR